jgi:multiple sugar transport system substrate-binding protein
MDKITTLNGGIGCRLSTWHDPDVNAMIPFYNQLEVLHRHTRELPRSRELPKLIHIIDNAVQSALNTREATESILRRAQEEADEIRL